MLLQFRQCPILQISSWQRAHLGTVVVWLETFKSGFKMKISLKLDWPRRFKVFQNRLIGPEIQSSLKL